MKFVKGVWKMVRYWIELFVLIIIRPLLSLKLYLNKKQWDKTDIITRNRCIADCNGIELAAQDMIDDCDMNGIYLKIVTYISASILREVDGYIVWFVNHRFK